MTGKCLPLLIACIVAGLGVAGQSLPDVPTQGDPPGITEINQEASDIQATDYPAIQALCFTIGALFGIAGGLRIYIKWNAGKNIDGEIFAWLGSCIFLLMAGFLMSTGMVADGGGSMANAINSKATDLNDNYFQRVRALCFTIGAIAGIVGGIRVYIKWNAGERHHFHLDAEIISWLGSCIFFELAAAFLDNIF